MPIITNTVYERLLDDQRKLKQMEFNLSMRPLEEQLGKMASLSLAQRFMDKKELEADRAAVRLLYTQMPTLTLAWLENLGRSIFDLNSEREFKNPDGPNLIRDYTCPACGGETVCLEVEESRGKHSRLYWCEDGGIVWSESNGEPRVLVPHSELAKANEQ